MGAGTRKGKEEGGRIEEARDGQGEQRGMRAYIK